MSIVEFSLSVTESGGLKEGRNGGRTEILGENGTVKGI